MTIGEFGEILLMSQYLWCDRTYLDTKRFQGNFDDLAVVRATSFEPSRRGRFVSVAHKALELVDTFQSDTFRDLFTNS